MTETDPLGARLAIQNAQFALQKGQKVEARRWAMEAAQLDPTFEEPWLILATLSSPHASVAYLQHALDINPRSDRAARGMQWALQRLAAAPDRQTVSVKRSPVSETRPVKTQPPPVLPPKTIEGFVTDADRWEAFQQQEKAAKSDTQPIKTARAAKTRGQKKTTAKGGKSNLAAIALILFFILCAILIVWVALPTWAALANSASAPLPADVLEKPTLTPTNTATATPSPTPTLTPTPTNTPTPIPTNTPLPTSTPWPTSTLWPTNTWLPQAQATESSYVEPVTSGNSGRWIDVDLTNQMLYAYEGDTIVGSFLVSTGVADHPTVTGQYYIYVKYTSTLMTGPGYYLPDVPYTMYFYQGYGIHGTYWHNNFGHPMSHGCVNMRTSDAQWMFNWASIGTLVNIHY